MLATAMRYAAAVQTEAVARRHRRVALLFVGVVVIVLFVMVMVVVVMAVRATFEEAGPIALTHELGQLAQAVLVARQATHRQVHRHALRRLVHVEHEQRVVDFAL